MLTEERYNIILELLREKRSVTVAEIKDRLGISESTIRRDLNALAQEGKLTKVFGGAVVPDNVSNGIELSVPQKLQVNEREKRLIAGYATAMIKPHDFVYLDAGTTTGYMLEYPLETSATFVTNAVSHARKLAVVGYSSCCWLAENFVVQRKRLLVHRRCYHFRSIISLLDFLERTD